MQPCVADAITEIAFLSFLADGVVQYGILAKWANVALVSFDTVLFWVRPAQCTNNFGR